MWENCLHNSCYLRVHFRALRYWGPTCRRIGDMSLPNLEVSKVRRELKDIIIRHRILRDDKGQTGNIALFVLMSVKWGRDHKWLQRCHRLGRFGRIGYMGLAILGVPEIGTK